MRKYEFKSITGAGETVYDMDAARIEKRTQAYTIKGIAAFTMPIEDTNPTITIDQTTTLELLRE